MPAPIDRRDILDAASRILADEGPGALTMRRIAGEVGASTMVVYTHFGDKDGLLEALMAEGFGRFAAALRRAGGADAFDHLRALGRAYRAFALENPSYYRLLWSHGRPPDAAQRFDEARRHGQEAFGVLLEAVTRVMTALDRPARDVEPAAIHVWATVHGHVSLELAGEIPAEAAEDVYERTLDYVRWGLGEGK
jgi:AcrR family transcriptional regulator